MSDYLELTEVKHQLRVLHNRDDNYIKLLMKAALKHIQNFLDRKFEEILEDDGSLPEDLVVAAYLILNDMYLNRAHQTEVNLYVNSATENYMRPYRRMGV